MQHRFAYLNQIFREEATSTLAGFHAGPLSWSNWNLEMLVFVEEEHPHRKARTNNKLNPHMAPGQNQTRATLVQGEHSHRGPYIIIVIVVVCHHHPYRARKP